MTTESDRRTFLKSAVSVGALAAVSQLPARADLEACGPSRVRGGHERMNINTVRIEAGALRPFSVLHISDTHLTDAYPDEDRWKQQLKVRGTPYFGGCQEDSLRESVAWARANCDYLVHTGDIIDWHSRKNLELARRYLGSSALWAIGNHEYAPYHYLAKEAGVSQSPEEIRRVLNTYFPGDLTFASQVVNGVNFISLDDALGKVSACQVERFKAEVRKGYPIVLLKHVPYYTDFIWTAAAKYWKIGTRYRGVQVPPREACARIQQEDRVTRDFIAYLKTVTELKAILAGHEHITVQDRFSPTAMEYVVGGNYLYLGQEILIS